MLRVFRTAVFVLLLHLRQVYAAMVQSECYPMALFGASSSNNRCNSVDNKHRLDTADIADQTYDYESWDTTTVENYLGFTLSKPYQIRELLYLGYHYPNRRHDGGYIVVGTDEINFSNESANLKVVENICLVCDGYHSVNYPTGFKSSMVAYVLPTHADKNADAELGSEILTFGITLYPWNSV